MVPIFGSIALSDGVASGMKNVGSLTVVWGLGTQGLAGPSLLQRLLLISGGQCFIMLDNPALNSMWHRKAQKPTASFLPLDSGHCFSATPYTLPFTTSPHILKAPQQSGQSRPPTSYYLRPHFVGGFEASPPLFTISLALLLATAYVHPLWAKFKANRARSRTAVASLLLAWAFVLLIVLAAKVSWEYHTIWEKAGSICKQLHYLSTIHH